jgi:hypothetical protein
MKTLGVMLATSLFLAIMNQPLTAQSAPHPLQSSPVPPWFFGMETHNVQPWPVVPFYAVRLWDTGTTWSALNPSEGVYDWTTLDRWLQATQTNGVGVLLTLAMTPSWASSIPDDPRCHYGPGECDPPNDLNADGTGTDQYWKDFVRAVATHAAGRIRYWEIWDEPNNYFYWEGTFAQMARMAKDARTIILRIDPRAKITTPPVAVVKRWWDGYAAAGGLQYADIIAFHGGVRSNCDEAPRAEDLVYTLGVFRTMLAGFHQQAKPIWDTEAQWGDIRRNCFTDQDLQAAFLGQFYLLHRSLRISRFFWYSYADPYIGQLFDSNTGQLTKAGVAYQQIHEWLLGNTLSTNCSASGTIWTCGLTGPAGYLAEVIWDTAETCSNGKCQTVKYQVKNIYTQYRTLSGQTIPITHNQVPIGAKPILVEN